MAKRKQRKGEYTCTCHAYRFPHRFGGGRCRGFWVVDEQWSESYGYGDCRNCNSLNTTEGQPYCEVVEGQERIDQCPVWQEFVERNEIRIYEK